MQIIIRLLINALAVFVTARLLPGIKVDSFSTAIVVAVVLGIVNTIIKPILLILTLPINILSLGLFTLVINGLLILLTSSIVRGFSVANFWWAIIFSLVISLVSWFLQSLTK